MSINSKMTKKSLEIVEKITREKLTLGKLIWAIRKGENMSQVECAKKLGISKQHLCDLEHNRKTVRPGLAVTYAKKLNYSEEQFVRLSLQEVIDREGLNIDIKIIPKQSRRCRSQDETFSSIHTH